MKSSRKQSQRQALKSFQHSSSASPFGTFHTSDEPLRRQKQGVTSLGCERATMQGCGLSLGEEQHPEFLRELPWAQGVAGLGGAPGCRRVLFASRGSRRYLCSNLLEPCKAADRRVAFWSMSQVCTRDVEPLEG